MNGRLKILGVVLAAMGLAFVAGGGYAFYKTNQGAHALQAFSTAQNVKLAYDDQGVLGGENPEEATGIMSLLVNDWGFAVDKSELNPNDPLVNTSSEYMYQMATIAYHTLHGATTVVLTEPGEFNGQTIPAGTYEFQNDGRYWTGFDRANPIEGAARGQLWTGTAHALIAELGVGRVAASAASASCSSSPASAWCGWLGPAPRRSRSRCSARRRSPPRTTHPGLRPGIPSRRRGLSPEPSSFFASAAGVRDVE